MKKKLLCAIFQLFIFSNVCLLFSQENSQFQQYQTFSWKEVPKAGKYQVDVEKQGSDGTWTNVASVQTRATKEEILLYPGEYRVSISAFNKLGKKGSSSQWVTFTVLNETEPYLYDDYLKKSTRWNSPVLHINQADKAVRSAAPGTDDADEQVVAAEGDPSNSFMLKAKNVFFPETKFMLVPADSSSSGGAEFTSFVDKRKSSPLTIVRRDRDHDAVVVSYKPDDLFSGYYTVLVTNPGGKTASLCILVLANRTPVIEKDSFAYDEQYKTYVLTMDKSDDDMLSISGSGFDNGSTFSFKPTSDGIPYPYATNLPREDIPITLASRTSLDSNGRMKLDFKLAGSKLRTGYYNFNADCGDAGVANVLLLVKSDDSEDGAPKVTKVTSAYNKTSNTVTFTVSGKKINKSKFTLVSAFNKDTGVNARIPLTQLDSKWGGAKCIFDTDASLLETGKYILIVENEAGSSVAYVDVVKNKVTLDKKITDEQKLVFLRPADYVAAATKQTDGPVFTYADHLDSVTGRYKRVAPFLFFDVDLLNFGKLTNSIRFHGLLDLFDVGWFAIKTGLGYNLFANELSLGCSAEFAVPVMSYFLPYLGAGIDVCYPFGTSADSDYSVADIIVTNIVDNFNANFYIGAVVFDFLDFKYTCRINQLTSLSGSKYFSDEFTVGCRIQLRQKEYIKNYKGVDATITYDGVIDGSKMTFNDDVYAVTFENGATEVRHFANFPNIKKISLPDSVTVIGDGAFENDTALADVVIPGGVTTIGRKAFANCTSIKTINIPSSVKKIDSSAFDGWLPSQTVILGWTPDERDGHDISGLAANKKLYIFYSSGTLYEEDEDE